MLIDWRMGALMTVLSFVAYIIGGYDAAAAFPMIMAVLMIAFGYPERFEKEHNRQLLQARINKMDGKTTMKKGYNKPKPKDEDKPKHPPKQTAPSKPHLNSKGTMKRYQARGR